MRKKKISMIELLVSISLIAGLTVLIYSFSNGLNHLFFNQSVGNIKNVISSGYVLGMLNEKQMKMRFYNRGGSFYFKLLYVNIGANSIFREFHLKSVSDISINCSYGIIKIFDGDFFDVPIFHDDKLSVTSIKISGLGTSKTLKLSYSEDV